MAVDTLAVSAGYRDITPTIPIPLCGFAERQGNFERVHDLLEINGVRLQHAKSDVLLLSADLAYLSPAFVRAASRAGEHLIAGASHTHFAPSIIPHFPRLGVATVTFEREVLETAQTLAAALGSAGHRRATIHHASGLADHAVNRRRRDVVVRNRWVSRRWVMAPNLAGARYEVVDAVALVGEAQEIVAVVWSYGCHPVGFPLAREVSADFPGRVRHAIRRRFGAHLPVVFLQGFSGNVRPRSITRPQTLPESLRDALNGPEFGRFSPDGFEEWSEGLARLVCRLIERAVESPGKEPAVVFRKHAVPYETFVSGKGPIKDIEFGRLDLATDLAIVSVSAEAMAEHVAMWNECLPGRHLIFAGCVGAAIGYLPTSQIVSEGGYEGGECLPYFDVRGTFRREIDVISRHAMERLAD